MINRPLGPQTLAADYKARGMDKFRAWGQFIIDRGLKPEMNAKEFYDIFNTVTEKSLAPIYKRPVGFQATHFDTLLNKQVQITTNGIGVHELVWEDGHTGSNPPCCPPEPERYVKLETSDEN